MKYDLKKVREDYGFTIKEMGNFIGIMPTYYSKYEEEGEIPSKYIYKLWLKLNDFPIPDDFFWYTSFTLMANMKYHKMTQSDIAKMFGFGNQSTISSLFSKNIPMYELKESFNKFKPLIIVLQISDDNKDKAMEIDPTLRVQELQERGNFICAAKKKKSRLKKTRLATS